MTYSKAILGLGSNIGNSIFYIEQSILLLEKSSIISNIKKSPFYKSKAILPGGADASWDLDFVNMAISGETSLSPQSLLQAIKKIEKKLGRKDRGVWGPREIDIDILLYGVEIINDNNLIIPHKFFLERDFALVPAVEIEADFIHPVQNKKIKDLLADISVECKKITCLTQY